MSSNTARIVDRRTYNGTILETGTQSHRLAHSRAQNSRLNADADRLTHA
jgi:hypothetical protein